MQKCLVSLHSFPIISVTKSSLTMVTTGKCVNAKFSNVTCFRGFWGNNLKLKTLIYDISASSYYEQKNQFFIAAMSNDNLDNRGEPMLLLLLLFTWLLLLLVLLFWDCLTILCKWNNSRRLSSLLSSWRRYWQTRL